MISACECPCHQKVKPLEDEVAVCQKKIEGYKQKLTQANDRNTTMQMALASSLLPAPVKPFKEIGGFPDNDLLLAWSIEARESDYLFVKFMMNHLWPEGFAGRSVTGRASNNPRGRPRRSELANPQSTEASGPAHEQAPGSEQQPETASEQPVARLALESEKVDYIKGTFGQF